MLIIIAEHKINSAVRFLGVLSKYLLYFIYYTLQFTKYIFQAYILIVQD